MDESGIDMKFDLAVLEEDLDFNKILNNDESVFVDIPQHDFMYYELKSKTVPESSPTFKSVTPTSRTHLKLQLMREQLQEQERREAVKQLEKRELSNVQKVPVPVQNVDVPPQVLQVTTALENPTRYHVIQKQKHQLRQFLSESFDQPLNGGCDNGFQNGKLQSAPVFPGPSTHPPSFYQQQMPLNTLPVVNASPENVLSPGMSSITTSTSEAEDFLEDILSFESNSFASDALKLNDITLGGSSEIQFGAAGSLYDQLVTLGTNTSAKASKSCPPDVPKIKGEPNQLSDAERAALAKDRQKKDNHNMIERRRRFNINDRIQELGDLLPRDPDPYCGLVCDGRKNKGTILKSSVEYIRRLKLVLHEKSQGATNIKAENKQLKQIARCLVYRIQELENMVKAHGLAVGESTLVSSKIAQLHKLTKDTTFSFNQAPVVNVLPQPASLGISEIEDLMDDDQPVTGDPMLSSPLVPSPGPSDHQMGMDTMDGIDNMNHMNDLPLDDDSFVTDVNII